MPVYELTRKQTLGESEFPAAEMNLKVHLDLEFHTAVPSAAGRAIALRLLRETLSQAEPDSLLVTAAVTPAPSPSGAPGEWNQPADLDLRVVKSAHRLVHEVSQRGLSGKAVLASELAESGELSAPTLGRLLNPGDAGHDYVRQFVLITPAGRTKALDLTPAGRLLASRIRANAVPV